MSDDFRQKFHEGITPLSVKVSEVKTSVSGRNGSPLGLLPTFAFLREDYAFVL
jgi:hypothetical protein